MRGPWVDPETTLLPHPRDVLAVEHDERETEARLELAVPLIDHRWGARDDDLADLLAEKQLARDQSGLDRLPEADVVGDEQVHAREQQGLAERLQLVGVELDPGTEGSL